VWLVALALLAVGCGTGGPSEGPSDGGDLAPGVFGEVAWGEATWQ